MDDMTSLQKWKTELGINVNAFEPWRDEHPRRDVTERCQRHSRMTKRIEGLCDNRVEVARIESSRNRPGHDVGRHGEVLHASPWW